MEYNGFDIISLKIDIDSCGAITYIPRTTSSLNIDQSIKYSREKLIEKSIDDNENHCTKVCAVGDNFIM